MTSTTLPASNRDTRASTPAGHRDRVARLVASLPPSGIRRFFDIASTMKDVLSLSVGEPDFRAPEVVRQAAAERCLNGSTAYSGNQGFPETRRAVVSYLRGAFGVEYDPTCEVLLTVGASEAIDIALRAILNPEDEVLVIDPCYVSYVPMTRLAGGVPVVVSTRPEAGFVPTVEEIEAVITQRTRAIVLCYPNNPTGATYGEETLRGIARLVERHDLVVISDEIYAELTYDQKHISFPSLPGMKERTILVSGFSKAFAMTGWRLGYACGPKDVLGAMLKIHQYATLCAPVVSQAAAVVAIEKAQQDIVTMREAYRRRRAVTVEGLRRLGMACPMPGGAFYAFADVRSFGMDDLEFCERVLVEKKVCIVPGSAFGEAGRGFARIAYTVDVPVIEMALARIGEFVSELG